MSGAIFGIQRWWLRNPANQVIWSISISQLVGQISEPSTVSPTKKQDGFCCYPHFVGQKSSAPTSSLELTYRNRIHAFFLRMMRWLGAFPSISRPGFIFRPDGLENIRSVQNWHIIGYCMMLQGIRIDPNLPWNHKANSQGSMVFMGHGGYMSRKWGFSPGSSFSANTLVHSKTQVNHKSKYPHKNITWDLQEGFKKQIPLNFGARWVFGRVNWLERY